jgi:hypothetical protein
MTGDNKAVGMTGDNKAGGMTGDNKAGGMTGDQMKTQVPTLETSRTEMSNDGPTAEGRLQQKTEAGVLVNVSILETCNVGQKC